MGKNERKLQNFLINPSFQLKFSLYFVMSGLALVSTVLAVTFLKVRQTRDALERTDLTSFQIQEHVNQTMFEITATTLVTFAIFMVLSFVYAIVISHRIAGPVVAIQRYIEDISSGNYDTERSLRKDDELQPIMNSLNKLAQNLKDKNS